MKKRTKINTVPEGAGWERISWSELVDRLNPELRASARWDWERRRARGRNQLFIRKGDGSLWQFKLSGGAWLRKTEEE